MEFSLDSGEGGNGKADGLGAGSFAITATSIEGLNGKLTGVTPAVRTADPGHSPEYYLRPDSCLGPIGPIGAWGPLGALGPLGDNTWNPSYWMAAIGDWSSYSRRMTGLGGPLSADGPLGPKGPLSQTAYKEELPKINDFAKQLQAGGVWTVLGPLGPLGALGPLGPLGPIGAHGYAVDADGNYRTSGQVVRSVKVPYGSSSRTYDLVEKYGETFAQQMTNNDASFLVQGAIRKSTEVDTYPFVVKDAQFVTAVVVPENALSDFDLQIVDQRDRVIAKSTSDGRQVLSFGVAVPVGNYVDFVQLRVPAGTALRVKVSAKTTNPIFPTYRLIVVGSTKYIGGTDIRGPHQVF